jgi:hypothetical protein
VAKVTKVPSPHSALTRMQLLFGLDLLGLWIADSAFVPQSGPEAIGFADLLGVHDLAPTSSGERPTFESGGWNGKGSILFASTDNLVVGGTLGSFASGDDTSLSIVMLAQLTATSDTNSIACGWVNTGTPARGVIVRGQATGVVPFFARVTDGTTPAQHAPAGSPDTNRHAFGWSRAGTSSTIYTDTAAPAGPATLNTGNIVGLNRFGIGNIGLTGFTGNALRLRALAVISGPISDDGYNSARKILEWA